MEEWKYAIFNVLVYHDEGLNPYFQLLILSIRHKASRGVSGHTLKKYNKMYLEVEENVKLKFHVKFLTGELKDDTIVVAISPFMKHADENGKEYSYKQVPRMSVKAIHDDQIIIIPKGLRRFIDVNVEEAFLV